MLVLSRKKSEEIIIGKDIVVRVIEICGDKVKLGLTAPKSVTLMRSEIIINKVEKKKKSYGVER